MRLYHIFKTLLPNFSLTPSARVIAGQLRKPSGLLAKRVGQKMNESNRHLYALAISQLNIKPADHVLEIGFGNGKFFEDIFAKADNVKICGVDFSAEMVKEANKNNKSRVKSGQLNLRLGTSENLPYKDDTFDHIICINVIYFWQFPEAHFKELLRVLKPGGRLYLGIRPKEILAQLPFSQHGFHLLETIQWTEMLEDIGYTFVDSITQDEPPTHVNGKAFPMKGTCLIVEKN
ncbi:MAG: class I SAM-dependent methyltransferase [Saprospiraceae bacterium]|nr:class I SAM-dependent methyltransferase [Saprospiraceae bacterium]